VNRYEVVSPGELHTYVLDLPPLPRDRISGAIRTRLRILHPGDPDDAAVDFHRNGDSPLSYLAFVADKAAVERYAGTGPAALPPVSVFASFAEKGEPQNIALFWADGWIEAARMAGPRVEAVESAPAGHDAGETIRSLRDSLFEKAGPGDGIPPSVPAKLFYLPDRSPPLGLMEDALAAAGVAEATTIEVDAAKVGRLKREYVLFSAPPRRRKILKRAALALAAANLALAAWTTLRIAEAEEHYGATIKKTYEAEKAAYAAVEEKRIELLTLMDEYALIAEKRSGTGYGTIAEIAKCVGDGGCIKSLSVRSGSFSVEAEGPDALAAFGRFGESAAFAGVKLQNVLPAEAGRDSFTVSGRLRDDRR
jgi:hypothetical protein